MKPSKPKPVPVDVDADDSLFGADLDSPLARTLDRYTQPGALFRPEGNKVRCMACAHRCLLGEGRRGICKVRHVRNGQLRVPFGYVSGAACDPIEKKPFFHVYPGADALTFGMLGCNFHCGFCQNWVTSQALRDEAAGSSIRPVASGQLVQSALREGARVVVSSYNEPLITSEWAAAIFEEAVRAGLLCAYVSNGYATAEAMDYMKPWLKAFKVDLKSFNDARYRSLGGALHHVQEGIRLAHERGLWIEVVTLIVPGFNDSEAEWRAMARFLVSISRDIPWHVTAFHPNYHMTDPASTRTEQLIRAAEIGVEEGLRFVYAGNRPGQVDPWENTICPQCRALLVERAGFTVLDYRITTEGKCPKCQTVIPGIWQREGPGDVKLAKFPSWGRRPRPV